MKNGSAWHQLIFDSVCQLLRLQQAFPHRLASSRSTQLLEESIQEILDSDVYRALNPEDIALAVWAASHAQRH